jgi:hypothetical protein
MSEGEKAKSALRYLVSLLIIVLIAGGVFIKRSNSKVVINYNTNEKSDELMIEEKVLGQGD